MPGTFSPRTMVWCSSSAMATRPTCGSTTPRIICWSKHICALSLSIRIGVPCSALSLPLDSHRSLRDFSSPWSEHCGLERRTDKEERIAHHDYLGKNGSLPQLQGRPAWGNLDAVCGAKPGGGTVDVAPQLRAARSARSL